MKKRLLALLPFLAGGLALVLYPISSFALEVFVSTHDDMIETFTAAGIGSVFASTGLDDPRGLAFDGSGNLYAANYDNNTIMRFTPEGGRSVFADTGLNYPFGLAFDGTRDLYVANVGNYAIMRFTPDGVGTLFANTPNGNNPTFITVIPEPSIGVLLSLCGPILCALRCRKV